MDSEKCNYYTYGHTLGTLTLNQGWETYAMEGNYGPGHEEPEDLDNEDDANFDDPDVGEPEDLDLFELVDDDDDFDIDDITHKYEARPLPPPPSAERPARSTDPQTSKAAGASINEAHCGRALEIFRRYPEGLAGFQVEPLLKLGPEACWWHRISDLRAAGYLEWVFDDHGKPVTRVNPHTNRSQQVSRITPLGMTSSWPPAFRPVRH